MLLFDWQRKCHHTLWNKVGLKYHNLIAAYSCIEGTTFASAGMQTNEINTGIYLIDAGGLKQGVLNNLVNPRLDSENSQKDIIYP